MGLLDKIKNVFGAGNDAALENEFRNIITSSFNEYKSKNNYFWSPVINETTVWTEQVKNWPDKKKVSFILWMLPLIHKANAGKRSWSSEDEDLKLSNTKQAYIQTIFRNKLEMDDEDAIKIYEGFNRYHTSDWAKITTWPVNLLLNQLERQRKGQSISPALKAMLEKMKATIGEISMIHQQKERIKMIDKIDGMLFQNENQTSTVKPARFLGDDPFADYVNPAIENMPDKEKFSWYALISLAQKTTASKPSKT